MGSEEWRVGKIHLAGPFTGRASRHRHPPSAPCLRKPRQHNLVEASESRKLFNELKPGDRVAVEHTVTVGQRSWKTTTAGTVRQTERRRHGLHFRRNFDDKEFSDIILLELPGGELTTVTLDEFTVIRRD